MKYRIVPYHPDYEASLLALEVASPQGRHIQLEMLRDRFLARSEVFDEFGVFLATSGSGELLGVAAGSTVTLDWNGTRERVGFVYDLRVAPEYRRVGIAKSLGKHLTQEFFRSLGIKYLVTTTKTGNRPATSALRSALGVAHAYPFTYLTIPTGMRVGRLTGPCTDSRFRVSGFGVTGLVDWIYRHPEGNPALFRTDMAYRVRVVSIAPWLNFGMRVLEMFRGPDWRLPRLCEEVRFAAAFDLLPENFHLINDLFEYLQQRGIRHLVVCCLKGDYCYRNLRRLAVNSMGYRVLGNLPLKPSDSLTLDVRCL